MFAEDKEFCKIIFRKRSQNEQNVMDIIKPSFGRKEYIIMADSNVLAAQKYLNAMFGGHPNWVALEEDGITGTASMEGIIRAFQIQNGISSITGTVGPMTLSVMKSLPTISKMDPDDTPSVNVCLIQCALFCKGYAAGGITGIYYTSGVAAVESMQEDAGLKVTGIIDWKVWAGLLSLNWFTKVSGGDDNIRLIQQQLNSDWSDVIGVGPCDGVASRQTVLSLVGALQAAEGVTTELITDMNSVNFGEATTDAFPGTLKNGQNSEYYIPFNKIAQYGLYFNGYNPGRFDGIYDSDTEEQVSEFQEFYALLGIGLVTKGEVNVSTMKSLLTSKGDTNRSAKACDCSTILNRQQALDLKTAGYTHVGRYLTGTVGTEHTPKNLTLDEVKNIENAGLSVFPIYQDGGYELEYFKDPSQGSVDAQAAILAAKRIGIPEGTTIYFAVDFDCYSYQIDTFIIPYFQQLYMVFYGTQNDKNYKIGIYAPRYVCSRICDLGYASSSFVADMSTGFSCNLGYPIPDNWAFDQFYEMTFSSSPSFPLDKDAYSGRDTGFSKFDEVPEKTEEEIEEENIQSLLEISRSQYVYNVFSSMGYLDKILTGGFEYNKEIPLGTVTTGEGTIEAKAEISTSISDETDSAFEINVSLDNSGKLTTECESQINSVAAELENSSLGDADTIVNNIKNVAYSIKTGNIKYTIGSVTALSAEFMVTFSTPDLLPQYENISSEIEISIIIKVTLNGDGGKKFNVEEFATMAGDALAAVAVVVVVCYVLPEGILATLLGILSSAVGTVGQVIIGVAA